MYSIMTCNERYSMFVMVCFFYLVTSTEIKYCSMFIYDNLMLTNWTILLQFFFSKCLSLGLFTSVTSLKVRLLFLQFISNHDKYLANFSSHLALWRVFILDLGCTYSVCKHYHFLLGYLWKKWVNACLLSSKNQDLINITSWKRYWGKWLVKKKENPHWHVKEGQGVVYEKSRRYIQIPFEWCIPRVNCTLSANSSMTGNMHTGRR